MSTSDKLLRWFWNTVEAEDEKRIARQEPTKGVTVLSDIPYIDDGQRKHLLDFYYPEGAEKLPVLIDIHGGGWMYGYKEINKYYGMYLASLGFTVISINYGLAPENNFRAQIQDVFAALHWMDENMDSYPCDRTNIFITGDSAGAHLAALTCEIIGRHDLTGYFAVEKPSFRFRAAAFVSGAFSLPSSMAKLPVALAKRYSEYVLGKNAKLYNSAYYGSAAALLEETAMPPVYLVSSKQDFIGFDSKNFAALLKKNNISHQFHFWDKGKTHALAHVFSVVEPTWEESRITSKELTDFLKAHLA